MEKGDYGEPPSSQIRMFQQRLRQIAPAVNSQSKDVLTASSSRRNQAVKSQGQRQRSEDLMDRLRNVDQKREALRGNDSAMTAPAETDLRPETNAAKSKG